MPIDHGHRPDDICPGCGGGFRQALQATELQRAKAANRDDPFPLPPHYDTAPLAVIAEHGELWQCPDCGYSARIHPAAAAAKQ